mgnify:FL=1
MLHSGNFGKLKSIVYDTFDEVYQGDISDLLPSDGNFTGILKEDTDVTEEAAGNS